MIKPCRTDDDYRQLLSDSHQATVFLLKHSTRCPISASARAAFERFADEHSEVGCWQVLVVEDRPLSTSITEETGIKHQSPQVILYKDGTARWHASHGSINVTVLLEALAKHG